MPSMKVWIDACRPKTLVAAVVPVAVGASVWKVYGDVSQGTTQEHLIAFTSCLLFAFGAQVASNFANDLGDAQRGADSLHRVGPIRAVVTGLISPRQMKIGIGLACLFAFLAGLPLGLNHPILFIPAILALLFALGYTLGPFPLAYWGLGDLFVITCFGLQATALTTYAMQNYSSGALLADTPWQPALLAGLGIGFLADNILLSNNARDKEVDQEVGKRTTVVLWGRGFAKMAHLSNILLGLACLSFVFGWVLWVLLPWGLWQNRGFRAAQKPADFIPFLTQSAVLLLVAGVLCVTVACLGWVSCGGSFLR